MALACLFNFVTIMLFTTLAYGATSARLLVCTGTIPVKAILAIMNKHVSVQDDLSQQEEAMAAASESPEASTEAQALHEEAFMTMDAVPELVQMMTDIQAALTEPEESADLESPTNGAQDMVQGNFWAWCCLLLTQCHL